jgi:hypothetical protein
VVRRATSSLILVVPMLACHRQPPDVAGGCFDVPAVGPPSSLELSQGESFDSALAAAGAGRLVGTFRWSSDSLAAISAPDAVVLIARDSSGIATDVPRASSPDKSLAAVERVLPAGRYHLHARGLGVRSFDTLATLLPGRTDTMKVRLQRGGVRMCI